MLEIQLLGVFECRWIDGQKLSLSGAHHQAILAVLASAPDGLHSRTYLRDLLWSMRGKDQAADSLRQAISALRKAFGPQVDHILEIDRHNIRLNLSNVKINPDGNQGVFLEGIDIPDAAFTTWLTNIRTHIATGGRVGRHGLAVRLRPRIAVVPFTSRANTAGERHLSDLFAQEISRALSRSNAVEIISHLSARQFVGKSITLPDLNEVLDVDYLVTGTLQVHGSNYRADIDFIEANNGKIIRTETRDGFIKDMLGGNNEHVHGLAFGIGLGILHSSLELAKANPLPKVQSHALFMSALAYMHQHRLLTFSRSRQHLELLTERHPHHSILHAWLAMWYLLRMAQGYGETPAADLMRARECCSRALEIDPACPISLTIDGMTKSHNAIEFKTAQANFQLALQNDPNNALAYLMYSRLQSFYGNGKEAVNLAERARLLSPVDPQKYFFDSLRATAYLANDDYEKARDIASQSLQANPRHTSSLRCFIVASEQSGDREASKKGIEQLLKLEPSLTVSNYLASHPAADLPTGQKWASALAAAGLPQ